jgi:hypothetical protein
MQGDRPAGVALKSTTGGRVLDERKRLMINDLTFSIRDRPAMAPRMLFSDVVEESLSLQQTVTPGTPARFE